MRGLSCRGQLGVGSALMLLLLGACGFHPMVGAHSDQPMVAEQLAQVDIDNIADRAGQQLRNNLIDRFYRDGRPSQPLYVLKVVLDTSQMTLAVQEDVSASRSQWIVTATYTLIYTPNRTVVATGAIREVPGFNVTYAAYSSFVSEQAAFDRAVVSLADDITERISLYFSRDADQKMKLAPPTWAPKLPPVTGPAPLPFATPSPTLKQ